MCQDHQNDQENKGQGIQAFSDRCLSKFRTALPLVVIMYLSTYFMMQFYMSTLLHI